MKILVLCDDCWHPAQTPRQGLTALENSERSFDLIENANDWSAELMADYPLVLLTKSNNVSASDKAGWMTDAAQQAFADYVRSGKGLLAIHSGCAEYEEKPVLRALLGGVFIDHPDQCPVTVAPQTGDPLCAGCDSFTEIDEHYFVSLDDTEAEVYVTTRSDHGEQPGAWRRKEGSGRVAVLTPGHNLDVWLHPSFQRLLLNTMHWCARSN